VGVYRHSIGELYSSKYLYENPTLAELDHRVDVRYKPLLKASELLLLLLPRDDKPIGIPQSVWRWSG
jgi:hypothetical protein